MVKSVNGIIIIDGCHDPNCGNNRQENPSTSNSTSGQSPNPNGTNGTTSNPLNSPKIKGTSPKVKESEENKENIMQALYGLSPPNFSSDSSDSDHDSDDDNHLQPRNLPDYDMLQEIVDGINESLINSVKDCFQCLVDLVTCFQFACVYTDVLSFFFSADELLSLENEVISRHFTIQENLYHFKEVTFKNKVIMYLRILREILEEERDDYERFNNNNQNYNRNHPMQLSLGRLEDTLLFIRKIRNLVRNGRHLRYSPMTWHNRLLSLFDDLNSLNDQSRIHFSIQNYQHRDFEEYTQFRNYKLE